MRKPTNEEATLTAKNYRLAKELSDLRVRHRDETNNVTRLTMENMNLASRCREAISHVTILKKELVIHQRKASEVLALQRQQAQRETLNLRYQEPRKGVVQRASVLQITGDSLEAGLDVQLHSTPVGIEETAAKKSIDVFEASFATVFPPSFSSPKEDQSSQLVNIEIYDPFCHSTRNTSFVKNSDGTEAEHHRIAASTQEIDGKSMQELDPSNSETVIIAPCRQPNVQDNDGTCIDEVLVDPNSDQEQISANGDWMVSSYASSPSDLPRFVGSAKNGLETVGIDVVNDADNHACSHEEKITIDSILIPSEEHFTTPRFGEEVSSNMVHGMEPRRPEKVGATAARARYEKALQTNSYSGDEATPETWLSTHPQVGAEVMPKLWTPDPTTTETGTVYTPGFRLHPQGQSVPSDLHASTGIGNLRYLAARQRRTVQQPISYAEPSLNAKLRRGDAYFAKKVDLGPEDIECKPPVVSPIS